MAQHPTSRRKPTQHGLVAWQGMSFRTMLRFFRLRPPTHPLRACRVLNTVASSAVTSVLKRAEWMRFGRRVREVQLAGPPLFVLGHWRSGTTLLHNLLACDRRFTYPNLYHVFCPHHFLLTESLVTRLTARFLPEHRPMDNMPCGWSTPQEDETALCMMTLLSPYLMMAFFQRHEVYDRYFEMRDVTAEERARWKAALLLFLKKLTVREPKPVILKSPTHTFRIPLLLEMFPDARFLYIYRNPHRVFHSTMHLRRTVFDVNGFAPVDETDMEEEVFRVYEHMFHVYERDRRLIPPGRLHEVRFEDLERDPVAVLREAYEAVGLPDFTVAEPHIRAEVARMTGYRKNRYDDDPETMRRIYRRWRFAFERFGYPSGLPHVRRAARAAVDHTPDRPHRRAESGRKTTHARSAPEPAEAAAAECSGTRSRVA
ncbi:MAG: sulfotransferase [Planctomycetota bacterium]|nr:MAG: sulfotransferase [Planctomycetota bacterium]